MRTPPLKIGDNNPSSQFQAADYNAPAPFLKRSRLSYNDPELSLQQRQVEVYVSSGVPGSEPKSSPSFDLQFVSTDAEAHKTLKAFSDDSSDTEVILMNQADGLDRDNLVRRLSIDSNGHRRLLPGKLFENPSPVKLVLDIRNMSAEELARFNDLLDPTDPCLFDKTIHRKRPLGQHVSIVLLARLNQLREAGRDNSPAPVADFWRRVNRPGNTLQAAGQEADTEPMDTDVAGSLQGSEDITDVSHVVIDLHRHWDWRALLFGEAGVDATGKTCHRPGKLEHLKPGQTVLFKGANPEDQEFVQCLRMLQLRRQFESNGKVCHLPEGVQLCQVNVSEDELACLRHSAMEQVSEYPENGIIVNQANLTQWLNPIRIHTEGYCVQNDSLDKQLKAGAAITVTSALSEPMWFLLLDQLQTIYETTGKKPQVFIVAPREQPPSLDLPPDQRKQDLSVPLNSTGNITVTTCSHDRQAADWLQGQAKPPLVIQINAQTHPSLLFDNIHIQSEQKPSFGHFKTSLQQALEQGLPVVLQGLDTNPVLQQFMESLCCKPSSIMINGNLQNYPKANIHLLWPESETSPSPLWNACIQLAEQCIETDVWEAAAIRHGMDVDAIPKESIEKIYKAFSTIPASVLKKAGSLPVLGEDLLDNLIIAARQSQHADAAETLNPAHWRKAVNSVLTHGTRQEPCVRDFMKFICERVLPDDDNQNWIDPEKLAQILASAKTLDRNFVSSNFWSLARCVGAGAFPNLRLMMGYF